MAELIAQGSRPGQRWRRRLPHDTAFVVGRAADGWSVPWDEHISRRHVECLWAGHELQVRRLPDSRNPVFYAGAAVEQCAVSPGEMFVVGSTTFSVVDEQATLAADIRQPELERTFTADDLRQTRFQEAAHQLEVLTRLPELFAGELSDPELAARLVAQILEGVPRAESCAIVLAPRGDRADSGEVLHWDARGPATATRSTTPCAPSARLVRQTVQSNASVLYLWPAATGGAGEEAVSAECEWAFCTPVPPADDERWVVYVAGKLETDIPADGRAAALRDELKFTELLADMVGRLRHARGLERRQAALTPFISPALLRQLGGGDLTSQLRPRECEVSVLFCDLRGFSRAAEREAPRLMLLLDRVSQALGVMTREILAAGGVIGDFHGDAAMGFWGWPLEQPDRVARACQAALAISDAFSVASQDTTQSLANFRIGIGIASGRAVAGGIGSADQLKITVFGPVVNLASRLQELTKVLRAPILVDEGTAEAMAAWTGPDAPRIRRVARIRPRGLDSPVLVGQLLPPASRSSLSDADLARYHDALSAFQAGDFDTAIDLLHQLPPHDRVRDFLTVFIAQHQRQAPPGWNGIIAEPQ